MKRYIFFLITFFCFNIFYAQNFSGKITSENGNPISGVNIVNIKNAQVANSDFGGKFIISAKIGDELRLVKDGYERFDFEVSIQSFSTEKVFVLKPLAVEIKEVKIKPYISGDLGKDSKQFNPSAKKTALLRDLDKYVKENPIELPPPKFEPGQVSFLSVSSDGSSGGVLSAIVGLVKKPKWKPTNDFASKEAYFYRIKKSINRERFVELGVDDYQLEIQLAKVIKKYKLYETDGSATEAERLLYDEIQLSKPSKK
jgi:hypothetical protein